MNGSAPNIVTAAQPFSNRIIEIQFFGIKCLTTLVELFSLDGGGTCQKRFFRISRPTGSGKPGASSLGESLDQEEPNDTTSLRIGPANLSIHP